MTVGARMFVSLAEWVDVCHGGRHYGCRLARPSLKPRSCCRRAQSFFFFLSPPHPSFPPFFPVTEEKNVKLSNCAVKLTPETVILVSVTAPPGSAAAPGADSRVSRLIRSKMNVLIKNPPLFFFFFFLFLPSSLGKLFYFV